jgi:uncharacterized membrane protein YgcG
VVRSLKDKGFKHMKYTIPIILTLASSINLSSLVIHPIPAQAKSVSSTQVPTIQRTWMPTFKSNKFIYLDPKLSGHPKDPFKFSDSFPDKLNQIGANHNLKIYVVGAQQGNEPIPSNRHVGIAKIDELLPQWSNQSGFDKNRYVILFWVRRSDDVSKGSVGVNVGTFARSQGVTPDLLSESDGLVIPALKGYMPQDPEGALLQVAKNVDAKVTEHIAELTQQRITATDNEAKSVSLINLWKSIGLAILGTGVLWIGIFFVGKQRDKAQDFRNQVKYDLKDWQCAIKNGSEIYLNLTENHLFFLEKLQSEQIDPDTQTLFEDAKRALAKFATRLKAASEVKDSVELSISQNDYQKAHTILHETSVTVNDETLPIEVTTLLTGLSPEESYQPTQIKKALNDSCLDARDKIVALNNLFDRAKRFTTPQSILSQIDEVLISPSVTYGLAWGETQSGEELLLLCFSQDGLSADSIKDRVRTGESVLRADNLSEAARVMSEIQAWINSIQTDYSQSIEIKAECDRLSSEVLQQSTQVQPLIKPAKQAIAEVVSMYPKLSVASDRQKCDDALKVLSAFPVHQKQIQSQYLAQEYGPALRLLKDQNHDFGQTLEHLSNIVAKPGQLARQAKEAQERVESYRRRISKLRSRSSVSRIDERLDGIHQQILLGNFIFSLPALDSVEYDISRVEHTFHSSGFGHASSSSDFGSTYSGHSSGFSGGGSYGGDSGGGSYGGGSGGGSY